MDGDCVVGPRAGDALSRPAVLVSRAQSIPIENAGDEVIVGDEYELANGIEDVGGGGVALAAAATREPKFGMDASRPVDEQDDLCGVIVDIGHHLVHECADDALLQSCVGRRRLPHGAKIVGQGQQRTDLLRHGLRDYRLMRRDLRLHLGDAFQRAVPAQFELSGHQTIGRIDRVILSASPICCVTGSLEIAKQGISNLVSVRGLRRIRLDGRGYCPGLDSLQEFDLDGVVDAQSPEGDATGLAVVEVPSPAGITRDVVLRPGVANGQLAATPSTQRAGRSRLCSRNHISA